MSKLFDNWRPGYLFRERQIKPSPMDLITERAYERAGMKLLFGTSLLIGGGLFFMAAKIYCAETGFGVSFRMKPRFHIVVTVPGSPY